MERHMKMTLITLALLSLSLAGCVIDPGHGYGDRGYGGRGYGDHGYSDRGGHNNDRAEYNAEQGQQGNWSH
jgi:hypothetical protein